MDQPSTLIVNDEDFKTIAKSGVQFLKRETWHRVEVQSASLLKLFMRESEGSPCLEAIRRGNKRFEANSNRFEASPQIEANPNRLEAPPQIEANANRLEAPLQNQHWTDERRKSTRRSRSPNQHWTDERRKSIRRSRSSGQYWRDENSGEHTKHRRQNSEQENTNRIDTALRVLGDLSIDTTFVGLRDEMWSSGETFAVDPESVRESRKFLGHAHKALDATTFNPIMHDAFFGTTKVSNNSQIPEQNRQCLGTLSHAIQLTVPLINSITNLMGIKSFYLTATILMYVVKSGDSASDVEKLLRAILKLTLGGQESAESLIPKFLAAICESSNTFKHPLEFSENQRQQMKTISMKCHFFKIMELVMGTKKTEELQKQLWSDRHKDQWKDSQNHDKCTRLLAFMVRTVVDKLGEANFDCHRAPLYTSIGEFSVLLQTLKGLVDHNGTRKNNACLLYPRKVTLDVSRGHDQNFCHKYNKYPRVSWIKTYCAGIPPSWVHDSSEYPQALAQDHAPSKTSYKNLTAQYEVCLGGTTDGETVTENSVEIFQSKNDVSEVVGERSFLAAFFSTSLLAMLKKSDLYKYPDRELENLLQNCKGVWNPVEPVNEISAGNAVNTTLSTRTVTLVFNDDDLEKAKRARSVGLPLARRNQVVTEKTIRMFDEADSLDEA